jgi:carboxyl-terminal processing protease
VFGLDPPTNKISNEPGAKMSPKFKTLLNIFFFIATTLISFLFGFLLHSQIVNQPFPLVEEAHSILLEYSLNDLPGQNDLEYGMIKGMLQTISDPFTIFVEPIQTELTADSLEGTFGGIGVEFGRDGEGYWVLYPILNMPAYMAGIQEADRLLGVDGIQILPDTSLDSIQAAIRGPVGKPVEIQILRLPDLIEYNFSITREEVALPSIIWHALATEPSVGVIKVNLIAASTSDEILHAVSDLQSRGVSYFILDLQDNGGGMLEAGIDTARFFLSQGVIIQQAYRNQQIETFRVTSPGPLVDIPLAVLINGGTASAAEILAGALQAHGRAYLIGEPTYGKNTLQLIFNLSDGSSMHVTSGRWWIPGLFPPLDNGGIQPDLNLASELQSPETIIDAAVTYLLRSG